MSDMTHDLADDGFHEIHLSGKQLVFLFMATTVVSVIIFLCGVLVGRGVPVRVAQDSLVDPTPATTAGAPAAAPTTPATAPAAADAGPIAAEAPAPTEDVPLSYKSRLESEAATKESLKRPAAAAPPTAARSAPAPAAEPPTAPVRPGAWVVQVHALRDRAVANRIVQRLSGKGYPAFLVASGPPTGTYKVQVGRFKDRDEAVKVVERLKKEEQFNPWITR